MWGHLLPPAPSPLMGTPLALSLLDACRFYFKVIHNSVYMIHPAISAASFKAYFHSKRLFFPGRLLKCLLNRQHGVIKCLNLINKCNSESSYFSAFLYPAGYWGWGAVTAPISQSQLGKLPLRAATTEGAQQQSCCYLHKLWQRLHIFYGVAVTEKNITNLFKNSVTDPSRTSVITKFQRDYILFSSFSLLIEQVVYFKIIP